MARLTTESYTKIILIILLGVLVCGAFVFGSCSSQRFGLPRGTLSEIGNARISASDVKDIEIDWAAGSVDVKVHNGDDIILTESSSGGLSKAQSMRWQVIGNTLKIDYGTWFSCMSFGVKHLEIAVPANLAKRLGEFSIDGASGSYTVESLVCNSFKASLASGSLDAKNVAVGTLKLEMASGDASLEGEIADLLKIETTSGKVNVTCQRFCPQKIEADMTSGDVIVSIPENDGFTAKVSKLSGNFKTDFAVQQSDGTYTYKGGGLSIDADMASGQFTLNKTS